jgi:hypothetical protein
LLDDAAPAAADDDDALTTDCVLFEPVGCASRGVCLATAAGFADASSLDFVLADAAAAAAADVVVGDDDDDDEVVFVAGAAVVLATCFDDVSFDND